MANKTFTYGDFTIVMELGEAPFGDDVVIAHVKLVEISTNWVSYKGTFDRTEMIDRKSGEIWDISEDGGNPLTSALSRRLSTAFARLKMGDFDKVPAAIIAGFIRGDVNQFDRVVTTPSQLGELVELLANAGENETQVVLMNHFSGKFGPPDLTL